MEHCEVCILSKEDFDEVCVLYPNYAQTIIQKGNALPLSLCFAP